MTARDVRAELAAHLLFAVLTLAVMYDLWVLWAPVVSA